MFPHLLKDAPILALCEDTPGDRHERYVLYMPARQGTTRRLAEPPFVEILLQMQTMPARVAHRLRRICQAACLQKPIALKERQAAFHPSPCYGTQIVSTLSFQAGTTPLIRPHVLETTLLNVE